MRVKGPVCASTMLFVIFLFPSCILLTQISEFGLLGNSLSSNSQEKSLYASPAQMGPQFRGDAPSDVVLTPDGSRLYIPCAGTDNVLVIDTDSFEIVDAIDLPEAGRFGAMPNSAAITPDGKKIYVVNHASSNVAVIDAERNVVISFVNVSLWPWSVEVTPDGRFAYVAHLAPPLAPSVVTVIDVSKDDVVGSIPVDNGYEACRIGFSSHGSKAFVAAKGFEDSQVYIVDTAAMAIADRIEISKPIEQHCDVAVAPDNATIYVTSGHNEGGYAQPDVGTNRVFLIDLKSSSVVGEIEVNGGPTGFTLSHDGAEAYVSTFSAGRVYLLNTALATIATEFNLKEIAPGGLLSDIRYMVISPDGRHLYMAGWDRGAIFVADRLSLGVISIELNRWRKQPREVVASPDSSKIYVSNRAEGAERWNQSIPGYHPSITVIDAKRNLIVGDIPLEHDARSLAITPDGKVLYALVSPLLLGVDTATGEVISEISLEKMGSIRPIHVVVVPGKDKAYVTDFGSDKHQGKVYVIDLSQNVLVKQIDVEWAPEWAAVTPDGNTVYVARVRNPHDQGGLMVIDASKDEVTESITPPDGIGAFTRTRVSVTPDGAYAYWHIDGVTPSVLIIEVARNEIVDAVDPFSNGVEEVPRALGASITAIAFMSDASRAYFLCSDANWLAIMDTSSEEFIGYVRVGSGSYEMALTPDNKYCCVPSSLTEKVLLIDLQSGTVIANIPAVFSSVVIDLPSWPYQRVDVGSTGTVSLHAVWEDDRSAVKNGIVYINGTAYTTNSTGWISFQALSSVVSKRSWNITGVQAGHVDIYDQIIPNPSIVWDEVFITLEAKQAQVAVGRKAQIDVAAVYAYDGTPFDGTVTLNDTLTKEKPGTYRYTAQSISGSIYGITVFESNIVTITFVEAPNWTLFITAGVVGAILLIAAILLLKRRRRSAP